MEYSDFVKIPMAWRRMKIRDRVRNAVRRWLFDYEFDRLAHSIAGLERNMRGDAHVAHSDSCKLHESIVALRDAEERHYRDLLHGQQEMEQKIDLVGAQLVELILRLGAVEAHSGKANEGIEHLINLVEPKAGRLRAGAPPVLDWDEVQRQNLQQQLEEKEATR